jgi:lambda family phage portal protein
MMVRMYQSAKPSRLTSGWGTSNTSADSELVSSLVSLRSRSRALIRDAAYAKRAKAIVQNNVIGAGMGLQALVMSTRDRPREDLNAAIEQAWNEWSEADACHTGGTLHFCDLERAAMGQVFDAGEVLIRKHYRAFGDSRVPFALELIEAERIADEFQAPIPMSQLAPGSTLRMGIEVDSFYRPVAYWLRERHPGELRLGLDRSDKIERVPASDIYHLRIVERWPQTRGEPWLHGVARKLNDMDGYSEAEVIAARGGASYMATIETPDGENPLAETAEDGIKEIQLEPGLVTRLNPGEKFNPWAPNRPNTALDPFMRYMLREVAAGIGVSYESLSRDYSQSNYSSSRLALLDDRDLWRVLQLWWIRNFRARLHRDWLQWAVLGKAIAGLRAEEYFADPRKYEAARFKPRGWSWIDPTKEVEAYKEAIKAGLTTRADVIAMTGDGRDVEDVDTQRRRELDLAAEQGLEFDTDPEAYMPQPAPASAPAPEADDEDDEDDEALVRIAADVQALLRAERAAPVTQIPPRIELHVNQAPVTVHLAPQETIVEGPVIRNEIGVPAPEVRIENHVAPAAAPEVRVENHVAPAAAPEVRIDNQVSVPERTVTVEAPVVKVAGPVIHVAPDEAERVTEVELDEKGDLKRTVTRRVRNKRGG